MVEKITSPRHPSLQVLCDRLRELAPQLEQPGAWPSEQLQLCGEYGVYEWFLPTESGGQDWSEADIVRGYLKLSAACLTTTFIITQRTGACQRIEASGNDQPKLRWMQSLLNGAAFATVGISHLTTSRRHLAKPVLRALETSSGFILDGYSPWVTGAPFADVVVIGATLGDHRQILAALPMGLPGISVPEPAQLVGLSASQTGPINCDHVELADSYLLAGPVEEVMKQGVGANTGGIQTSTLAVGLADAAIGYLEEQQVARSDLVDPTASLRAEWHELRNDLLSAACQEPVCSNEKLRTRANSLALRASQAALAAAKGTGYVVGHPTGRWCREALFFLVWSCPQPVLAAHLCELAGIIE